MAALLVFAALGACWRPASAQEAVRFPSLDDNGPGATATLLDGYLYRPASGGRGPAVVALHGCSGLLSQSTGFIMKREQAWAAELTRRGYAVLFVDSFRPRNHGEMCSVQGFDVALYRKRPRDAYGALAWLQAQPFIDPARIGLIGWSQGGGATLLSIGTQSWGRPQPMQQPDFRAAVAFYPGSCNEARLPAGWVNAVPLLALIGADDVWTPLAPCQAVLARRRRGAAGSKCRSIPARRTISTPPTWRGANCRITARATGRCRWSRPSRRRAPTPSPECRHFSPATCNR